MLPTLMTILKRQAPACVFSLAALCSLGAMAQSPGPLKLGIIGPMSGGSADFGQAMLNGIEIAVSEINAVGGYLGRPIELVVKDDKGDPETGLKMSEELVKVDKVVSTIGFCNTGVAIKAIPVFQSNQSPLIVPCAAGSPVTQQVEPAASYIFRVSPSEDIKAPFMVKDILRRGLNKVAIFADATPYGESGKNDVVKALAASNLKPVHVTSFPLGVKDLSTEMEAARAAGANVIIAYTVGPENAVIARSRAAVKWTAPLVGPWTLSFPNFIDTAGPAAEGTMTVQTFIAEPSNERRVAFLSAYKRMHKDSRMAVPMASAQGYDAVYLLTYSLFGIRDGRLTGPAIKAQLEDIKRVYYGVVATYDKPFSTASKDAVTENMLVMGLVRNGAVTFAYPEDAKRNLFVQRKTQ
ncbi:branched-chain amino acid transport system substrate-binding protein [Hydrogenophaga palleronii]|uniref:Branched-chain amino acid transport system substrate-binding protein n=1 Tax=Hydrogenophaga palleronii TaxID=65655 RepID=A0ABU1WTL3_9BURK|nr:branched-chain amino acid transport system substrate-binding protein [Hydrogenophaga palleronii]